jgi:hypothetical protein
MEHVLGRNLFPLGNGLPREPKFSGHSDRSTSALYCGSCNISHEINLADHMDDGNIKLPFVNKRLACGVGELCATYSA